MIRDVYINTIIFIFFKRNITDMFKGENLVEFVEYFEDDLSCKINRSIYKQTIFHKLIERIVKGKHQSYIDIISVNK